MILFPYKVKIKNADKNKSIRVSNELQKLII